MVHEYATCRDYIWMFPRKSIMTVAGRKYYNNPLPYSISYSRRKKSLKSIKGFWPILCGPTTRDNMGIGCNSSIECSNCIRSKLNSVPILFNHHEIYIWCDSKD